MYRKLSSLRFRHQVNNGKTLFTMKQGFRKKFSVMKNRKLESLRYSLNRSQSTPYFFTL